MKILMAIILGVLVMFLPGCSRNRNPVGGINPSFHDKGYENAFVGSVKDNRVKIFTIDTELYIVFRVSAEHISRFKQGRITPVTFECGKKEGKCDLSKPYKMYVASVPVEVLEIEK